MRSSSVMVRRLYDSPEVTSVTIFRLWSGAETSMAPAVAVAKRLHNQGIGVTVVDPRWVLPVPDAVLELAVAHKLLVTLEGNGVNRGPGQRCRQRCGVPRSTCRVAMWACRRISSITRRVARCWPTWVSPTRMSPAASPAGLSRWVPALPKPRSPNSSTSGRPVRSRVRRHWPALRPGRVPPAHAARPGLARWPRIHRWCWLSRRRPPVPSPSTGAAPARA